MRVERTQIELANARSNGLPVYYHMSILSSLFCSMFIVFYHKLFK